MPRVSIKGTNQVFEINEGEILYDALFDRGLELPHGCLSGSCGACRVEVSTGKDQLMPPGAIESNTIDALRVEYLQSRGEEYVNNLEIRLSCRAKVQGNVTISPLK